MATDPIQAAQPAPTAGLSSAQVQQAAKAAKDFEAMAIGQMLQPMFNTVDTSGGMFGGGRAEATWKPMLIDEMAKMMEKNGGIGLADSVMREMLRAQAGGEGGKS